MLRRYDAAIAQMLEHDKASGEIGCILANTRIELFIIAEQRKDIHRWIKILLFLGILMIPLYSILDYFNVHEGLFLPFLMARLTASAFLTVITLVVHFSFVSAIDHLYGYLFTIVVGGVISWMTVNLGVPWKYVHTIANALDRKSVV